MTEAQCKMLADIRAVQFSLVDLNLYLDTHPDCNRALTEFNRLSHCLHQMLERYNADFGPLYNFGVCPGGADWVWTCDPWPWATC